MNYTVTWTRTALDQLAAIWTSSVARNDVTLASHQLEQAIATRPLDLGESRQSTVVRWHFLPPLGMEYEVIEDDKRVKVLRIWSIS